MKRFIRRLGITALGLVVSTASAAQPPKPGASAFLKSLVVPGWGQYSLGYKRTALAFLGADLALLGGILALNSYGRSTRSDYEAIAAAYAGVVGGHGHAFYVDVGNWMNVDDYNEYQLRQRDFEALYLDSGDRWSWDTDAHRAEMYKTRLRSDQAFSNILYIVGGLVVNHAVSAVHAARLARHQSEHRASLAPSDWALHVQPLYTSPGLRIHLTHSF